MRYVIGVNGGSTATTAVLADATGNLLGFGQSASASFDRDLAGAERVRKSLGDAVSAAIAMADLQNARISAACINMPGDPDELEFVCAPVIPVDHFSVGIYSHIALNTVSLGAPGVVVVADLGAEGYGVNARHETASVGGWGQPQGDEGSSYWIALRALNACCRALDGTGPSTQVLPLLLQHLEADSLRHVFQRIHREAISHGETIAILDVVGAAAVKGDATARRILHDAGKELGTAAVSLLKRLDMSDDPAIVGTVGSVFRTGRLVLRAFRETVLKSTPSCRIIGPQAPSCVGAAISALEEIGVEIDEDTVCTIVNSLPRCKV